MTSRLTILAGIACLLVAVFAGHKIYSSLLAIVGLLAFIFAYFSQRREEKKQTYKEAKADKNQMIKEARESYKRKNIKRLLSMIDSFDIPEKTKHEIYNIVVSEKKSLGGTVKNNPYKNE